MGLTHGRGYADFKEQKSLGNFPYTQLFAITGVINDLTTDWKLVTPNANLEGLPYSQLTTPAKVKFASTSANDTIRGTGARVIVVTGLDRFYNIYEEIGLMNGQTPVETTNEFARVFEIAVIKYGSNTNATTGDSEQVGDIYVGTGTWTAGVPTNPLAAINASEETSNSREAIFTVPDGKLLLLNSLFVSSDPDKIQNTSAIIQIAVKPFGFGDNTWYKTLNYHFDNIFDRKLDCLIPLPPRTDIQLRAKTNSAKTKTTTIELTCELKDIRV